MSTRHLNPGQLAMAALAKRKGLLQGIRLR